MRLVCSAAALARSWLPVAGAALLASCVGPGSPAFARPPPGAPTGGALCFGAEIAAAPAAVRLFLTGGAAVRMTEAIGLATGLAMPAATAIEATIPLQPGPVSIRMIRADGRCPALWLGPALWLQVLHLLDAAS